MQSSGNIEANIRDCLDRQAGVNGLATGRDWAERHAEIAGIWPPLCQAFKNCMPLSRRVLYGTFI